MRGYFRLSYLSTIYAGTVARPSVEYDLRLRTSLDIVKHRRSICSLAPVKKDSVYAEVILVFMQEVKSSQRSGILCTGDTER